MVGIVVPRRLPGKLGGLWESGARGSVGCQDGPLDSLPSPQLTMNQKLLLGLLVLVALLVGGALYLAGGGASSTEAGGSRELSRGVAGEALAPSASDEVLAAAPEPPRSEEREAVTEPPSIPKRRETSEREASALPSDVVWVEGVVIFPTDMPLDAGPTEVTARGRRYSKQDSRREYITGVDEYGRFRVAFARATRTGWIDVSGRFLYMDDKLSMKMKSLPSEVTVEPKLGGVVRGRVTPPPGESWSAEAAEETRVTLWTWSNGRRSRTVSLSPEGTYELSGMAPGSSYTLRIQGGPWMEYSEEEVEVEAGVVTTRDVELRRGARVSGRVVDREGQPQADVPVELFCEPLEDVWHHQTVQTEPDGTFSFRGIVEGEVRITAAPKDALPVEKELGLLHDGDGREDLELEVDLGRSITGFVRWPDGSPASGAWVKADQERETETLRMMWGGAGSVRTEGDGSFTISGLEDAPCVVRASSKSVLERDRKRAEKARAEGRTPRLRKRGSTYRVKMEDVMPGTSGLVLVLEPGDTVKGKAVDDQGQGLTRFLISARPVVGPGSELDEEDGFDRVVVSLDGSFSIDGLRDGRWKLTARADDHASSNSVEVESPGAGEVEFTLPRLARVQGVVRGPGGEPLSGASVFVEDAGDESEPVGIRGGLWGEDAGTDNEGRFEALDQRPGRKAVFAGKEGFGQSPAVYVDLAPGQTLEGVSLRLRAPARITGVVHAAAGEIAGRQVSVSGVDGVSYWESFESDSSGGFEVDGLSPGRYRLELLGTSTDAAKKRFGRGGLLSFEASGDEEGLAQNAIQYVTLEAGGRAHVVLGSPPADPVVVRGRVTSGGEALVDVRVSCRGSEDPERNRASTRTDSEGGYSLTVSGAGSYDFQVGTGPSRSDSRHEVGVGTTQLDFELPVGRVAGRVLGEDGAPLEGATLQVRLYQGLDGGAVNSIERLALSDDEGTFEFEHLPPGVYSLRVSKEGRWSWRKRRREDELGGVVLEGLRLEEGAQLTDLETQLEASGSIRALVLRPDGVPAARATVWVDSPTGHGLDVRGRTDSEGRVTLTGVGPGKWRVQARGAGSESEATEVRVHVDSESEVTLSLEMD